MTSTRTARIHCYGKLPFYADFIGLGMEDPAAVSLQAWIRGGRAIANQRLGASFDAVYDVSPTYDFLWPSGNRTLVFGRLVPSRDAAGRRYPFAILTTLEAPKATAAVTVVSVCQSGVHEAIVSAIESCRAASSDRQVVDTLSEHSPTMTWNEHESTESYGRFVSASGADDFWESVLGKPQSPLRFDVMQTLSETLELSRGKKAPDPLVGLRFPLSPSGMERICLQVAFWLDLTTRRLSRTLNAAYCLWTTDVRAGVRPAFFLFFSIPSPVHWTSLIDLEATNDTMSYLDRPYGTEPAEDRMTPRLRQLLESPGATLNDYLAWADEE